MLIENCPLQSVNVFKRLRLIDATGWDVTLDLEHDLEERISQNQDGRQVLSGSGVISVSSMSRFIAFVECDPFGRRDERILRGAGAKSRPT